VAGHNKFSRQGLYYFKDTVWARTLTYFSVMWNTQDVMPLSGGQVRQQVPDKGAPDAP
jgi:hypothetical protein